MGLGRLFSRSTTSADVGHVRQIADFAIIDGVRVDGSGMAGARYRGGMSIPGAYRAAIMLSDLLGMMPWDAYRRKGKILEAWSPRPPLLEQPNPPETRINTISSLMLDAIWDGNAVGVWAARDSYGYPTAVLPIPSTQVGVRRRGDGEIEYAIGTMRLSAYDVLHIKGPAAPGELRGMGALEYHMFTGGGALETAREMSRQAAQLSRHGVPTGILKTTNPNDKRPEMQNMKDRWLENQRDRTIQVVNSSTEFTPIAWNPEEMELIEARKFSLHEVALIIGLPLSFLGADQSSRTYSNIEQDAVNLQKFYLGGHLARFEQALSLAFPRGTEVMADMDKILRADTLTRYQGYKLATDAGWLDADEIREEEGRKPRPKPKPAPPVNGEVKPGDQQIPPVATESEPVAGQPVNGVPRPNAIGPRRG